MKSFIITLLVAYLSLIVFSQAASNKPKNNRPANARSNNDDDDISSTNEERPFRQTCGGKAQVAIRAANCMEPIFELVEGRGFGEAKSDADIVSHCDRFARVEKCVRGTARECLDGVHKTAAGAMAASSRRFRTKECKTAESRTKYFEPTKCVLVHAQDTRKLYKNLTDIAFRISELPLPPEDRIVKMCCLLLQLEEKSNAMFAKTCPDSMQTILSLQRAITDDARNTLCRNPKCTGNLDKLPPRKASATKGVNLIEPIMLTMFDL